MTLIGKIGSLVSVVALATTLSIVAPSYAGDRYEPAKGNNLYSKKNTEFPVLPIVIDKSLPHYLQGIRRIPKTVEDYPIHRWLESWRVHTISLQEHQNNGNFNFVNQAASFTEKIHGRDVRFILQDYMIASKFEGGKNKKVLFYNGTGGVKEFPMEELGKIKKDLVYRITESSNRNVSQFKGIFSGARAKLAKRLGMIPEEFQKQAEKTTILRNGFKVENGVFLDYPVKELEEADFVPNTVVFGNHAASKEGIIYAAVYPDTGIMYLTPLSVKLEHITDGLSTTRHEGIHANRKMQNYNLNKMMDVELFAAFPWLDENTPRSEMYGSYFNAIKWTIKSYMCFDVDQARLEMTSGMFNTAAFRTDEASLKKFRKYAKWIDSAKSTLKKATKNALIEFYSDPSWFGGFNERLGYPLANFDLLMAQQLEPTCLGGPKKTLEWIAENQGKIDSLWEKAVEEIKKDKAKRENDNPSMSMVNNPELKNMYNNFMLIRNQHGQKMAEFYLLENMDKLALHLKSLSGENLQSIKKGIKLMNPKNQQRAVEALESRALSNRLEKIK